MGEQDELTTATDDTEAVVKILRRTIFGLENDGKAMRFARLCDGGRLAHFMTPGMMTGVPPRIEHYATRASVMRRFRKGVELNLPVAEDRRALAAFRLATGESDDVVDSLEYMMEVGNEKGFRG